MALTVQRDLDEQAVLERPAERPGTALPAENRFPVNRRIGDAPPSQQPELPKQEDKGAVKGIDNSRQWGSLRFAIGLPLVLAAAAAGYLYWDHSRRFESTDDAFIAARQFPIAAKVSGYITAVPVRDNQHVATGDVIAQIDDRDYRVALDQAQAQVDNADAATQNIDALISFQEAQITVNQAQLEQAQAVLVFAEQQAQRYRELADKGTGTIQNEQQYDSQFRQQQAAVKAAQAAVKLPQRQIGSLDKQRHSQMASLAQATAQRDQAQLNLSNATIRAAQPGRIVTLSAAVGQFAQVGTTLTMFVPDEIWVTANFKETQLGEIRPGQPVTLAIDAYPTRPLRGHIDSVQPGSGTAFSLLPAQNATGNYVKIVQRVPVKIVIEDLPADMVLGPGMSVVPTVRVSVGPSLYERLRSWL